MKHKNAKITAFLISLILLLVFASTVGYSMISKSDKSITSSFDRSACDLEDYDGDGESNFYERSELSKQPCPCDPNNLATSWGYVPKNTTFNRKDATGPYVIFDTQYKDELSAIKWISAADFEEMEMQLTTLRELPEGTQIKTSMIFSDELEQYKRKSVEDKQVPSTFFCPKSCAGQSNDYKCCSLATFQKEWFEAGYDDFGLVGQCKTNATECQDRIEKWCADRQAAKKNGKVA